MSETFLDKIFEAKLARVEEAKQRIPAGEMRLAGVQMRSQYDPHRLRAALSRNAINIIAEFKRASPSKGVINDSVDVEKTAATYQAGGAAAISVLTEEDFFKGSLRDIREAKLGTSLPVLRKDFIFDEYQIYEAAAAGADAILLIAAMLEDDVLQKLFDIAENEFGMDALVEVHNAQELKRSANIGASLIGVNNRDLHSFNVSLNVSRELISYKPPGVLMIAESGITSRDEIIELRSLGFDGFLVGEMLMRSGDPETELRELATDIHRFTQI